ncbi:MAG: PEP-utilizing enzyme [Candidatus Micrarchaeota archaeon]
MDIGQLDLDLANAAKRNIIFGKEPLVLARTENSDLLSASKESGVEFFERVFSSDGPLWRMYQEARLGYLPENASHLNFIAGRMYFLRNVEKKYLRSSGMEKNYAWSDGKLTEFAPISPQNALLFISSPFGMLSQALDISLLPLYVDEKMREFGTFKEKTLRYYSEHKGSTAHPVELAKESLANAVQSMHYSFISSLAAAFKIKMRNSGQWGVCEAETLFHLLEKGDIDGAARQYGFHSVSPYDISAARFHEDLKYAKRKPVPFPLDPYARLRENAKFQCSRYLDLMRDAYVSIGEESGIGGLVFYLKTDELESTIADPRKWKEEAQRRKKEYDGWAGLDLPDTFVYANGAWVEYAEKSPSIVGIPAGAPMEAKGEAVFINEEKDYSKSVGGKIIISKTFSPNLASILKGSAGIISSSGGVLAHTAIIAREMGIPCIVSAKGVDGIKEGQIVTIDGKSGKISI